MDPRPYQLAARDAVLQEFTKGVKSTLLLMATGTGKTVTFALTADAVRKRLADRGRPHKTLILAHRQELLEQAAEKLEAWTPHLSVGIEQGDRRVTRQALPDILIASVPSLSQPRRLAEFDHKQFGFMVTDESHRAVASTYQAIYRAFSHCYHLGVTATPDRTDKTALGSVFESVAFGYDLRNAIEDGYLVPIYREQIEIEGLDLSRINPGGKKDFTDDDLEEEFLRDGALLQVADTSVRLSRDKGHDRQGIIFCPGVRHAELLTDAINSIRPASAACIHGGTPSRDQILRRYKDGQLRYLANFNVLTEGIDLPATSIIPNCRPTKSRLVYAQAAGRGTRLHPGKTDCLIVDFTDASSRHDLVSPMDIFDGNLDLTIKERAEQIAKRKKTDALTALKEATEQIGRERQLALAREIAGKTRFTRHQLDAFTVLGITPRAGRYLGQEITPDQHAKLERQHIPVDGLDKGQAEQVIEAMDRRRQCGLSTPRQAKILMRYGFDPNVPFEIANSQIDYIARRKWSITPRDRDVIRQMAGNMAA